MTGKHANEKIQILLQITYFSEWKVEKYCIYGQSL